jgi:hypothetical protein
MICLLSANMPFLVREKVAIFSLDYNYTVGKAIFRCISIDAFFKALAKR